MASETGTLDPGETYRSLITLRLDATATINTGHRYSEPPGDRDGASKVKIERPEYTTLDVAVASNVDDDKSVIA